MSRTVAQLGFQTVLYNAKAFSDPIVVLDIHPTNEKKNLEHRSQILL